MSETHAIILSSETMRSRQSISTAALTKSRKMNRKTPPAERIAKPAIIHNIPLKNRNAAVTQQAIILNLFLLPFE